MTNSYKDKNNILEREKKLRKEVEREYKQFERDQEIIMKATELLNTYNDPNNIELIEKVKNQDEYDDATLLAFIKILHKKRKSIKFQ